MKTILLVLVAACVFSSVNAACADDCTDCTVRSACMDSAVAGGCAWNFSDNSCDPTPSGMSDCTLYNGLAEACADDTSNCGYYKYDDNTCNDTGPTNDGSSDCSDLDNYKV